MTGGFNKTGWHWTRKGWKRTPKHLQSVKKIATATKRRPFKKVSVKAAQAESLPTYAEARKLAVKKAKAESAATLAPEADKPAHAPPRKGWGGKYDGLTKPPQDLP